MSDNRTLKELEELASSKTLGFYWTIDYTTIMIFCYCMMGLLGSLSLPIIIYKPYIGIPIAVVWYFLWFGVIPFKWRTSAARKIVDET